jgi:hypothetical protein
MGDREMLRSYAWSSIVWSVLENIYPVIWAVGAGGLFLSGQLYLFSDNPLLVKQVLLVVLVATFCAYAGRAAKDKQLR